MTIARRENRYGTLRPENTRHSRDFVEFDDLNSLIDDINLLIGSPPITTLERRDARSGVPRQPTVRASVEFVTFEDLNDLVDDINGGSSISRRQSRRGTPRSPSIPGSRDIIEFEDLNDLIDDINAILFPPTIVLSALSIAEDASNGAVIGELSVPDGTGTYVFTIVDDPDDEFALEGDALDKSGILDYETATSHDVQIQADNGIDAPLLQIFTIAVTNVAPFLANALVVDEGATTVSTTVDTTEDNGTLYWVVTTSGTAPTAAQVKAGEDHTGAAAASSGSQAITSTGTKVVDATGLSPATAYYVHFMHEDDAPSDSNVASTDTFTTDAYMLDVLGVSAERAYSMRRLRLAYAGSAIRVRRSSDNAQMDVGFVGEDLDTATMLAWSGSDSVYRTKFYDQSGNGDDYVQATAGLQPRIVNAGVLDTQNGKPAARFDSVDDLEDGASAFGCKEACIVCSTTDAGPTFGGSWGALSGGGTILFAGVSGGDYWDDNSFAAGNINVNNTGTRTAVFGGVLMQVSGHTSSNVACPYPRMGEWNFGNFWHGHICEALYFAAEHSSGVRLAQYNNQSSYWGTP